MDKFLNGGPLIIVGAALIIFRRQFSRYSVDWQNKMWGFHFGKKVVDIGTWLLPLIGLAAVIDGILALLR